MQMMLDLDRELFGNEAFPETDGGDFGEGGNDILNFDPGLAERNNPNIQPMGRGGRFLSKFENIRKALSGYGNVNLNPQLVSGLRRLGSGLSTGVDVGSGQGGGFRSLADLLSPVPGLGQTLSPILRGVGNVRRRGEERSTIRDLLERNSGLGGEFDKLVGDPIRSQFREQELPELVGQLSKFGIGDSSGGQQVISQTLGNLGQGLARERGQFIAQRGLSPTSEATLRGRLGGNTLSDFLGGAFGR